MPQLNMYPAQVNSPQTELSAGIDNAVNTIPVIDAALLPAAPNLAVIGSDETAETILYTGKSGNNLTGCTRGFQGTARVWSIGAKVARYFTAYDADTTRLNLVDHETRVQLIELAYPIQNALRQAMINGGFMVNQRVKSGTVVLSAGQYGHDRWKAGSSGCTYTFVTVNNVTTITITAGSLVQVIEGINLSDGTYTLSWAGTAQGKIGAGSYGSSGITGTVVGGTNLSIEFNTGTLSKVQFNIGSVALPNQPRSFPEEFALCRRYYRKSFKYAVAPVQNVGAGDSSPVAAQGDVASAVCFTAFQIWLDSPMRVAPTVTTYNPSAANNQIRNFIRNADFTSTTVDNVSDNRFRIYGTSPAASAATDVVGVHWTADAEL